MIFEFIVETNGPRPPFGLVADHLWGAGVDIDSDGNSRRPDDHDWTELTVSRRPECIERVDVGPVSEAPLILKVRSESRDLAFRAATFIAAATNGRIIR